MYGLITLGIVGAVALIALVVVAAARHRRPQDLGSVSAAWTTEHNIGYRGGDGSSS